MSDDAKLALGFSMTSPLFKLSKTAEEQISKLLVNNSKLKV